MFNKYTLLIALLFVVGCSNANSESIHEHHHEHNHEHAHEHSHHHGHHHHHHDHDHGNNDSILMSQITWVVSTTPEISAMVTTIGGRYVGTYVILNEDSDPATHEPNYGDKLATMSADVVFYDPGIDAPWFYDLMQENNKAVGYNLFAVENASTIRDVLTTLSPENEEYFLENYKNRLVY